MIGALVALGLFAATAGNRGKLSKAARRERSRLKNNRACGLCFRDRDREACKRCDVRQAIGLRSRRKRRARR